MFGTNLTKEDFKALPAGDLFLQGLKDLEEDLITVPALVVMVNSLNLIRLGFNFKLIPDSKIPFEHQLYQRLEQEEGANAYSKYNSLLRMADSFVSCLR